MAIDVHIHTRGKEDGNKILKAMDQVGLKRVVLFAVPPHRSEEAKGQDKPHKVVLDTIANLVKVDPERLIGFAWNDDDFTTRSEGCFSRSNTSWRTATGCPRSSTTPR